MLREQLLRAEQHGPLHGGFAAVAIRQIKGFLQIGQGGGPRRDVEPRGSGVEHRADGAPVQRQRQRRAERAAGAFRLAQHVDGVTLRQRRLLTLLLPGGAWHRPGGCGQGGQIGALTGKGVDGLLEPVPFIVVHGARFGKVFRPGWRP